MIKARTRAVAPWLVLMAAGCAHLGPVARREAPCQGDVGQRGVEMQGHLLWGVRWRLPNDPDSGPLFEQVQGGAGISSARLNDDPRGQRLVGVAGDGRRVELAVCGVEPAADDGAPRYLLQYWDETAHAWQNPCLGTKAVPAPRALVLQDIWDKRGSRQRQPTAFTLACENGALAKCVAWGYQPWQQRGGKQLADHHQACTRMARADYCGTGRAHTADGTLIDIYDDLGVQRRTNESDGTAPMSFEAAWTPDGAYCLARARHGAVDEILAECPERFSPGASTDLGQGDRCTTTARGVSADAVLLRNRSRAAGGAR